jgi:pilus assembly protein FimV
MDFSLDLPAEPADRLPAASTDTLDLDIMGFDIPEVPAFTVPPKVEPEAIDFEEPLEPLELPVETKPSQAAASPAPEFDLSGIDFDLDKHVELDDAAATDFSTSAATPPGAAAGTTTGAAPAEAGSAPAPAAAAAPVDYTPPARDDTMSAHHMEMDTKLDLAIAYQEIGDKEGARELLDEVLRGGSDDQIAKANDMKAQLG